MKAASATPKYLVLCGMLLALLAGAPRLLPAQERLGPELWKRGYHGVAALCEALQLERTDEWETWRRVPPRQSVLLVFGAYNRLPTSIDNYVNQGGAVLLASDRGDDQARLAGLNLITGPLNTVDPDARLHGFADCPIVNRFDVEHPVTANLLAVATNRPGGLVVTQVNRLRWRTLAWLPRHRWFDNIEFLAARESPAGGRLVVVADQTVFANQMLLYEDNAQLTANVLRWLAEGERTTVLIVDDQQVITPPMPDEVEVEIPPPTPEQVKEALRHLPPEALLSFANAVVASAESAGVPNDVIKFLMEKISPRDYRRLLVFASLGLVGLLLVHRLFVGAASEVEAARERESAGARTTRDQLQWQRQRAAIELLERFRLDVAATSAVPWKTFASRLRIINRRREARQLRRALLQASRRVGPDDRRYWTRRRLERLDEQLRHGRRLWVAGALQYRAEDARE